MPPRRTADKDAGLSVADVEALESTLAAGKPATVYLRDAVPSLNLPAGASAKIVRFADGGVVVRPRGVDDELPFELDEVRLTRNPPATPAKAAAVRRPPAAAPASAPREVTAPAAVSTPAVSTPAVATPAVSTPAVSTPAASEPVAAPAPAKPRRAPKKLADGVLVTIHGGTDNLWTVGVTYGPRPPGKANPVTPDAVERAVGQLGDESARLAIDSVLTAAREAVANRIDELNRQLAEARAALAALGSAD